MKNLEQIGTFLLLAGQYILDLPWKRFTIITLCVSALAGGTSLFTHRMAKAEMGKLCIKDSILNFHVKSMESNYHKRYAHKDILTIAFEGDELTIWMRDGNRYTHVGVVTQCVWSKDLHL